MPNYLVRWEIDLWADSPEEAAQEAFKIHRDPESIATVFQVQEELEDRKYSDPVRVDVME